MRALSVSGRSRSKRTATLLGYQIRNVARGRAVIGYGLALMLVAWALVRFGGGTSRALLSMGNVVLIVVPLVSLVLGTIHFYDSREFDELVLAHPVDRRQLFQGLYLGLTIPMSVAYLVAVLLPLSLGGMDAGSLGAVLTLAFTGVALTAIFVALAYWIAVRFDEPMKGLGLVLATWLFFGVLYDGFVLMTANAFSAYPLERPMLALMMLNPVDLARVMLLMQLDVAALMGYTGAVFKSFFGGAVGPVVAIAVLAIWTAGPFWLGMRRFDRKDL